jgi:hypothetical protein
MTLLPVIAGIAIVFSPWWLPSLLAWLGGFKAHDPDTWPGWFLAFGIIFFILLPVLWALAAFAVEHPIIFALLACAFGIALLNEYFSSKKRKKTVVEPKREISALEAAEKYWPPIRNGEHLLAVRYVALQLIRDELRRQGHARYDYSARVLSKAADEYLREHPELIAEARKRVIPSNPVAAAARQ